MHRVAACLLALAAATAALGQAADGDELLAKGDGLSDASSVGAVLPPPDPSRPTVVKIGIYVINVVRVDAVARSFTADFFLRAVWQDPRLAGGEEVRIFDPDEIWNPGLVIQNRQRLFTSFRDVVRVDRNGNCRFRQRYFGELTAMYDLIDFPFDSQTISIEVVAISNPAEDITLEIDRRFTGQEPDFSDDSMEFGGGEARVDRFHFAPADETRARFGYAIEIQRHRSYYFWKILLPLAIIVFMSWTVFWIDPVNVGPQVGTSVTSVLTLIAYRFMLGTLVPQISYLTRLDLFILGATVLVFLGLVVAIATSNLAAHGRHALAMRIDRTSRIAFPTLFVIVVVLAFVVPRST